MANSLLEIETILPPLLEQQISPPYRIVARHLDYLQKWREYLSWVWTDDSNENIDRTNIQQSVDELISTILLIDFVRQSDAMVIPALEEILKTVNKPTAFSLCEAVYNQTPCKLLKTVFDPARLSSPKIKPQKDVRPSSLTHISEAVEAMYGSRMPITLFGDFHQLCIERPIADKTIRKKDSGRRDKGIYYTLTPLVDYLVFHTLKKVFHKLESEQVQHLRILDPSCGGGAFLIASLRFVLKWLKDRYNKKEESSCLSPQKNLDLLESMIYGTDIDEWAIEWTRRLLLLTVWDSCIKSGVSENDIRTLSIPTLEENIVCKDFLEEQSSKNETFHVIIGGPPFVRVQELYKSNPIRIDNYKRRFRTARSGQFDLYMLFIEKAIELLADRGYLSMSVSNTFLRSEGGRTLRRLIAENCSVSEIVEFKDSKLYPNALVQVAAIMLHKTAERYPTKHVFVKGKGGLRRKLSKIDKQDDNAFLQTRNLPATACASENWILRSESETNLLYKIESVGIPLGRLPVHIRFGAATEADKVFLLKSAEYLDSKTVLAESRFLDDVFVFEASILRPVLRGRHIKRYTTFEPETLCIFPYDNAGNVIAEDILRMEFSRTYKYLKSCQSYLSSRKLKHGQHWYAFRSEDVSSVIQSPKIVASVVNCGGGFALDEHQHIFCNNSVIILCPDKSVINPYFLLAVLNSSVFWRWTQHRMPTLGSGWHSYRVGIIRKFPIPMSQTGQKSELFSSVTKRVRTLLHEQANENERRGMLSTIDDNVRELYGISNL